MKKSLKNLKQFRKFKTRSKFQFYVVFRPKAQKWFLPILALILLGGIMHHEHTKEYVFENPKVAVVEAIRSMPESGQTGSPVAEDTKEDATLAKQPQTQTSGSSSSTTLSPERASDVEVKKAIVTTYNAEEAQTDADPFTMASGKRVYEGAVASNCYKIGTKLHVFGLGEFTVEDRMNSRYTKDCGTENERLDIFKWHRKDNFKKIAEYATL